VSNTREFDLVLFGATGFTGGLVAEHVAGNAHRNLRFALAGRRADALHGLRDRLMAAHPDRSEIGVIVADVGDPESMARMAGRTRAVLSTVGPFVDFGEAVVRACVAEGTDYLDSTGEHVFMRKMVERYDDDARRRGVRLIFSCAFESVPTDLGVFYTVHKLPPNKPIDIDGYLAFRGKFSGGTERSSIKDFVAEPPGASDHAFDRAGRTGRILPGHVHRAAAIGAWVTPFKAIDPHVVLRSAAALERYGPRFTYTNLLVYRNVVTMLFLIVAMGAAGLLAHLAPLRALMLKLAKPSGQGPTQAQMNAGWFRLRLDARCDGQRIMTEVSGGDPAYGTTSMMLGQCALCLLEDAEWLPECSGVVTTAQLFGDRLIARLQAHGMEFRVVSDTSG